MLRFASRFQLGGGVFRNGFGPFPSSGAGRQVGWFWAFGAVAAWLFLVPQLVALAAVAQHDAEDVCLAAFPLGRDDRRAAAEVDLSFLARTTLHPAKGQGARAAELLDEPPHAVVADGGAGLDQVLPDPLSRELFLDFRKRPLNCIL